MPNAFFPFGANCNPNVINNDYIVFDIAFCNPPMQQSCEDIVRMQPSSFADAYFLINYVKVFCRPGETCYTGNVVVG
uniref:Uncharacterized protein n=1 Tax=Acrobeloides nanus TaxID=290746 RepID=A0A914CJ62_9BILA